jgi:PAS domain S-box-containing protein
MNTPPTARLKALGISLPLLLFAAAIIGLPFVVYHTITAHAQSEALREARAFSSVISIVRSYYANNVSGRIQRANGLAILTERYHNLQGGVPIPATLSIELGEAIRERLTDSTFLFSFVSDAPFLNRDRPRLDGFQSDALRAFRRGGEPEFWRLESEATGGSRLRLAIPVVMEEPCVACHNTHPDSPVRTWKTGDVRGIQDVSVGLRVGGQAQDSIELGLYLIFFVGSGLWSLRDYQRRGASLRVANDALEQSRTELQSNAQTLQEIIADLRTKSTVIEKAPFGIAISNPYLPDMPLMYVNEAFTHQTGYRADEVIGRNCRFLQGAGTSPEAVDAIREAIASRATREVEILNYRRDGQPFWNRFLIFPSFDEQGRLLHFVGCQTDITELKRAELARKRLSGELQMADQLAVIRQSASRSVQDIQAPLGHAISNAHELEQALTASDGQGRALAQSLRDALAQVSRRLSRFDQFTTGTATSGWRTIDLATWLTQIAARARDLPTSRGCLISVACPAGIMLHTNTDTLERVLMHLIDNALSHAFTQGLPRDGARVMLRGGLGEQTAHLSVIDNGNGLRDPVILRALGQSEAAWRSSGLPDLGLFADRRRVEEQLGGQLTIQPAPGGGTECSVLLPCRNSDLTPVS